MPRIPFVGQTYTGRSSNLNAQRCVNWFPVFDQSEGKNARALVNMPGTTSVKQLPGIIRGMHVVRSGVDAGERLFVVSGDTLYELDTDYNETSRGTLVASEELVRMTDNGVANGDQLMVVEGLYKSSTSNAYVLNMSSPYTFSTITDPLDPNYTPGFPDATHIEWLDGYFIALEQNAGRFYVSSLYNGLSWDGTDFATAESNPDNLVSMIVDHRELWLFGELSTEVWQNVGDADFPFARIPGAVMEWGCSAPYSVAKMNNNVYWLGQNTNGHGHVIRTQGYQPQVISNPAIEYQINQYSTFSDAQAFTFQMEGNNFYVLTFPTADRTWVFNEATGQWNEWAFNGTDTRHHSNAYVFFNGKHIVGDYRNGKIYELDFDTYTDDGTVIERLRRAQYIAGPNLERIYHNRLQVDFEAGVGLVTGQGSDPQAMLRWSDDGGHTWSNELWAGMGAQGKYGTRSIWRRLGSSRSRVYELKVTDPVKPIVIGAHLRAGMGAS